MVGRFFLLPLRSEYILLRSSDMLGEVRREVLDQARRAGNGDVETGGFKRSTIWHRVACYNGYEVSFEFKKGMSGYDASRALSSH